MDVYSLDECLRVQMDGFKACDKCSLNGTEKCGGKDIKEKKMNSKGYLIGENGVIENKTPPPSKKKKKKKK